MTLSGCQECGANTYSAAKSHSCTECPDDKISRPGSVSQSDCESKHLFL